MKIQFLEVQKNLAKKQQKNLAEKLALIENVSFLIEFHLDNNLS